jgi:hypothetical protein
MSRVMLPGDTARLYHRLSSYVCEPEERDPPPVDHPLVRQDFVRNDVPSYPPAFKAYPPGLSRILLPRLWTSPVTSATDALAGRAVPHSDPPDVAAIARLLYLSAAFVRFAERSDGRRFFFRTSRSAGGLFPLELYVAARAVDGLADGVHWYDPLRHGLVQVGPPPVGDVTSLIVTGIPWRTGWRYAERGFRHLYWDAGTTLAHPLALADAAGLGARLWTRFDDAAVGRLVGADGVQEFPLAVVVLGTGDPAIRPGGEATSGSVDEAPIEFPLVTLAQHAGDGDCLGEPWPASLPVPGVPPPSADLDCVIVGHRSTRVLDPAGVLARETFDWCVALGLRGTRLPTFIAVHAVEGLEPGLYRWPDLARPIREGVLRDELYRVCWEQELGRDASFVVISAVDIDRLDDPDYRDAQLGAGIVDGRLHLAAYALGIGASGMTFLDSEIEALLGDPLAGLLLTCVGRSAAATRAH